MTKVLPKKIEGHYKPEQSRHHLNSYHSNIHNIILMTGIHTTVKTVGSTCNYDCKYCFYLEKGVVLNSKKIMSLEILEQYIRNYISSQETPIVEFAWHGGEPTLSGLDFFEKAVVIQKKYAGNKVIKNTLQTNGSKIDKEWCQFFLKNNFLVGLSLDGPEWLQRKYRTKQGKSVFQESFQALKLMQKMQVEFNVLACVTKEYCKHAESIYTFFKKNKIKHIQFTPIVEVTPLPIEQQRGQNFSSNLIASVSGDSSVDENSCQPMPWSVNAQDYGQFLVDVFNLWIKSDVGQVFITNFEQTLTQHIGNPSPNCIHAEECGTSLSVESNGDVYFCDHVAYPESHLGNVLTETFVDMKDKAQQLKFNKKARLSSRCKSCSYLKLCNGGCPKHRHLSNSGEYENILCEGYLYFFQSTGKYLQTMTTLLANGYPAAYVMQALDGPLVLKLSKKRR